MTNKNNKMEWLVANDFEKKIVGNITIRSKDQILKRKLWET